MLSAGLQIAAVELELAGGLAHPLFEDYADHQYPLVTPVAQARVAVDFLSRLSLGGSFLAVIGGEAPNRAGCCGRDSGNAAFSATALLLSLRYQSEGKPQYWVEGGMGTGHLISLQTDNSSEHPPLRGHAGICARIATGARWAVARNLRLGGELAWVLWTNVEQGAGQGPQNAPAQSGLSTNALLLLGSIAFSGLP